MHENEDALPLFSLSPSLSLAASLCDCTLRSAFGSLVPSPDVRLFCSVLSRSSFLLRLLRLLLLLRLPSRSRLSQSLVSFLSSRQRDMKTPAPVAADRRLHSRHAMAADRRQSAAVLSANSLLLVTVFACLPGVSQAASQASQRSTLAVEMNESVIPLSLSSSLACTCSSLEE